MNRKMPRLKLNNLRILRFMVPMRGKKPWRLTMNRLVEQASCLSGTTGWMHCPTTR